MQTLVTLLESEDMLVMTNDVSNITSAGTMTRTFSFSKEGIEEVCFKNIVKNSSITISYLFRSSIL